MFVQEIPCRTILNPTGGFLGEGFTHTINVYRGCALGNTLCGLYCYAQWNPYHLQGRKWGSFLDVKEGPLEAYRTQYDRLKRGTSREAKPIKIFMSSVTEPYPPQERSARRTRQLLREMIARAPDALIIQTHTSIVTEDIGILKDLHQCCELQLNITVETDRAVLPEPFPRQAFSPQSRFRALQVLRDAGLHAVATVSPLLPLENPYQFAQNLEAASDRVILDHYLLGDGSPQGKRTKQTLLPRLLTQTGYDEWNTLEKFHEVVNIFRDVFGDTNRVGLSKEGFNASTTTSG